MKTLKVIAQRYNRYMTLVGRKRACEVLLSNSDRMLEDAGFSRALLEKGVTAWPWLAATTETYNADSANLDTAKSSGDNLVTHESQEKSGGVSPSGNFAPVAIRKEGLQDREDRKVA